MIYVDWVAGYRDDYQIHDVVALEKARLNADAAILYQGENPRLAEYFLDKMKFDSQKLKNYSASFKDTRADALSNVSDEISHVHEKCSQEIRAKWGAPMSEEEVNEVLLEKLLDKSKEVKELKEQLDFLNFNTFFWNL